MHPKTTKAMLAIAVIVLGAFYVLKQDAGSRGETTTRESWVTTTLSQQEKSTKTTPETTTTISINALPECLIMKTQCKKDRCYFGNAINRRSAKLCEEIGDIILRGSCLMKADSNKTTENAVIEGQIFNTINCRIYQNLTVQVTDESKNATVAVIQTNTLGVYSIEVTPGLDYGIYAIIGNQTLKQELKNLKQGKHIVDFALS